MNSIHPITVYDYIAEPLRVFAQLASLMLVQRQDTGEEPLSGQDCHSSILLPGRIRYTCGNSILVILQDRTLSSSMRHSPPFRRS